MFSFLTVFVGYCWLGVRVRLDRTKKNVLLFQLKNSDISHFKLVIRFSLLNL